MANQCCGRLDCYFLTRYRPLKRFISGRDAFRSLWSQTIYYPWYDLLPDFLYWHHKYSQYFSCLCFWFFSGNGKQFSRCRNLSQPDGGIPPLPQHSQYFDKSLRLQRSVPAANDYQSAGMGRTLVWLVLPAGGSRYDTQRCVFISLSVSATSRASYRHPGSTG